MSNIDLARLLIAAMQRIAAINVCQQRGNHERAMREHKEVEKPLKALDDYEGGANYDLD